MTQLRRRSLGGFSLVELLVASGLLVMLAGSLAQSYRVITRASRQQQALIDQEKELVVALNQSCDLIELATSFEAGGDSDTLNFRMPAQDEADQVITDSYDSYSLGQLAGQAAGRYGLNLTPGAGSALTSKTITLATQVTNIGYSYLDSSGNALTVGDLAAAGVSISLTTSWIVNGNSHSLTRSQLCFSRNIS
ncbi:MAG: hypothetical protein CEO22_659 [Candidatus Berkelbacteria bacterium Gr01-1014_85]|uniref:Prepilin-type N-terminal cleavage/methylation domain-containing protein n=1 Tax=Candidatus Berkelbacteria bacterium Gr01-1014_85 TaxID=2017150 RepID=A0A554J9A2_9BACT|nr:MAG: hypothetical protein CEO22_659 [Candidatus Berkelbacteria bacterium Gr01-1014_85]